MDIGTAFQQLREANPVPDPELLTDRSVDFGSLLAASRQRSTDMQTDELTRPKPGKPQKSGKPQGPARRPWLLAAAAAAAVFLIGAVLVIPNIGGGSSDVADQPPPAPIDINAADPIQAGHDQGQRVTVRFAGNAKALAEGGAYLFELQVHMDGSEGLGGREFTVTYANNDGVITTTGTSPTGEEVSARWDWFADDGVQVTLLSQSLPDTRPEVLVSVQATASSEVVEFVMDSPAGPIG